MFTPPVKHDKVCKYCGADILGKKDICPNCKKKLVLVKQFRKICKRIKKEIENGAKRSTQNSNEA